MDAVKHILIATDGSELSLKAAAFGGVLARALTASVSVVMVNDERMTVPEAWGAGSTPTEDVRGSLEARALENEVAKTTSALGDLASAPNEVVLWGHVGDQLCRFAADNDVDLIVIGSHGRTGIKRAILGSVSHSVANQAPCAVTIVR